MSLRQVDPLIRQLHLYRDLIQERTKEMVLKQPQNARHEKRRSGKKKRDAEEIQQELEWDCENYCDAEIDRYIEQNSGAFEALKDAKWKEDRERFQLGDRKHGENVGPA